MPCKRKSNHVAEKDPPIPKRAKTHRSETNPWEASRDDTYSVDKIVNQRYHKGQRQYLVKWEGSNRGKPWADTWEPMENLVGCAKEIREYEALRAKEDLEAKAAVLEERKRKREEQENHANALRTSALADASDATLQPGQMRATSCQI